MPHLALVAADGEFSRPRKRLCLQTLGLSYQALPYDGQHMLNDRYAKLIFAILTNPSTDAIWSPAPAEAERVRAEFAEISSAADIVLVSAI
ncbi:hypothetical protein V475_11400 [Sphingobium baderi LL03]|uniref:Uncharacterized protein n=1 Tax=Sphingobium baderi LL03 TaxID=1114964 RepID=T0HMF0_9SPHN|nr:hypothetical protein L485_13245 [Sphingobium baderi LL03]KMS61954.1 hypothetical protein V475_11400 [Sphingobium baderi LL03]